MKKPRRTLELARQAVIVNKSMNYYIKLFDPSMHLSLYVSQPSSRIRTYQSSYREYLLSEPERHYRTLKENQNLVEKLLLFKKINKPFRIQNRNGTPQVKKEKNTVLFSKTTNSLMYSTPTSRAVTKYGTNSMRTTSNDKNNTLKIEPLPKIPEVSLSHKRPEKCSNTVNSFYKGGNPNSTNKKKSTNIISYQNLISSIKLRRRSIKIETKFKNEIESMDVLYSIENRIISDCIGKTYFSEISDDNQSCFFTSSGSFHCPLFYIFGVIEGNGPNGKQFASLIRSNIHTLLTTSTTYGFKTYKGTEEEIYEAIVNNDYKLIRLVNERIHEDISKLNLDLNISGAVATVVFIIGKKLICANIGDIQAVAFLEKKENKQEYLQSKLLSSLDIKLEENQKVLTNSFGNKSQSFTGIVSCSEIKLTDDYINIIIASKCFWENMSYASAFKIVSSIKSDNIITRAEEIMDFKEKQNNLYQRKNKGYSFVLIQFY